MEDARDVAQFVYQNAGYISTARLIWEYSFIIFPLFVLLGTLLFKLGMSAAVGVCGCGRRYCNIVILMVFFTLLLLASLLFIAFYPFLVDSTSSSW